MVMVNEFFPIFLNFTSMTYNDSVNEDLSVKEYVQIHVNKYTIFKCTVRSFCEFVFFIKIFFFRNI